MRYALKYQSADQPTGGEYRTIRAAARALARCYRSQTSDRQAVTVVAARARSWRPLDVAERLELARWL